MIDRLTDTDYCTCLFGILIALLFELADNIVAVVSCQTLVVAELARRAG